ncbi:putative phage PVL protein [Staphylococcus aureus]|uniref:Putative phage PVL protein n=1 Tax=Staphylococcus aureus TaxID=1280 RepID=A0A380EII5_STAAU|nr:putative phage PVL protein [Staphylococcus aureus]
MGARKSGSITRKIFFSTGFSDGFVRFHPNTNKCSTSSFIPIDIPFIVDIEKEVTEETKFDRLLEVYEIQEGVYMSELHTSISINERLENTFFPTKAFYILNDGLTMTLIWKDGELVE